MGNKFLPALESIRGLAALFVVCYHWKIAEVVSKNGYLSVDLFFVISGYIIAKLYLVFLIKLGCLLALSELTYRWIENPCRLFVRNYTNKKAAQ